MKSINTWRAEKLSMERAFNFIVGRPTKIIDIGPLENDLGYTSADGTIHLAYDHPIMASLSDTEKIIFRRGVFCHETMHQIFTDFRSFERTLKKLPAHEKSIFALINNVLEDPAIEHFAPTVIEGPLLKSLRFAIAHTYRTSSKLEESSCSFSQYVSALIQFGDMGLPKGRFTFPEAKKCFNETAEIFEQGILEPDPVKRLEYSLKIFETSRPLWQERADAEKAIQELMDALSEMGRSPMRGSGSGRTADADSVSETSKDKNRKVTIKKVSKEEMEEMRKKAEECPSAGNGDGDVVICVCDEDKPNPSEDKGEEAASASDKGDSDEKTDLALDANGTSSDIQEETSDEESSERSSLPSNGAPNKGSEGEAKDSKGDRPEGLERPTDEISDSRDSKFNETCKNGQAAPPPSNDAFLENDDCDDYPIDEEDYTLSEGEIASILANIEEIAEDKVEGEKEDLSEIPNFDIDSAKMPHKSCLNYRVMINDHDIPRLEDAYARVCSKMSTGIHTTTKALKRIFEDDREEKEYRCSGAISLKRIASGSVSPQIFEKKISPADKSDLAVEILVDESGSMRLDDKAGAARECCIALAEIFYTLNVPVYIIGFTADCDGHDVVHAHYITWKNSKNDRLKLLNISARYNNCDGASVRYATEILKKKNVKNKLLIVISDGVPAASGYHNGMSDTRDAVRAAKKHASVLGVAVGKCNAEGIQYLYEKDFLHVSNVNDLFAGISKKMKNIIKTW